MKNRIKKFIVGVLATLLIFVSSGAGIHAATKTSGMSVMGSYTWAIARLIVYYNSSTKVVSGANTERTYTFPGATNVVNKVTAVNKYSASGSLTATINNVKKTDTVTVSTS